MARNYLPLYMWKFNSNEHEYPDKVFFSASAVAGEN